MKPLMEIGLRHLREFARKMDHQYRLVGDGRFLFGKGPTTARTMRTTPIRNSTATTMATIQPFSSVNPPERSNISIRKCQPEDSGFFTEASGMMRPKIVNEPHLPTDYAENADI